MATTTNFGWETPDDTDLVKDGAAAMRTLGNAIDTSFVDLKGGTTNQVLAKNSNTDLDFKWVTSAGDIEGVTAGVGITGGGTSGTVTITNDMATKIDAKGDLIVGTGADTYDRLAVGTNDYVLTAASGEATGMKWAAAPSPSYTYTNFTPTVTQGVGVTVTVSEAAYTTIGNFVHAYCSLVATSAGTASNAIIVTFPAGVPTIAAPGVNYESPFGVGEMRDNSASLVYRCLPVWTGGANIRFAPTNDTSASRLGQVQFTAGLNTDDRILFSVFYRKA